MINLIVKRCQNCPGLCCTVAGEVDITLEEVQILSTVTGKDIDDISVRVSDGLILRKGPGLACKFLDKDHKCTVYKYRPKTCREYTCNGDPVIYQLWRSHRYVRNG